MVPTKVAQSQRVPRKIPHDEGKKSCARLLMMIM